MKHEFIHAHMEVAYIYSKLSSARRKQVGCILVKDDRVISIGYNGTPPGWSNICEDEHGHTYPWVYHAESNAITKLAKTHDTSEGAYAFCTLSPCLPCAMIMAQSGIAAVFYGDEYSPSGGDGRIHLNKCKIDVTHFPIDQT